MEFSELGNTGLSVSRLIFGCAPMSNYDYGPVNDSESIAAAHRAIDLGVTFFDTADVYGFGHAEKVLGRALGNRRNKVFIATKFGLKWDKNGNVERDCSPKRILRAVDDSLMRLQVDVIGLYQIHWPDPNTPLSETMGALRKCQEIGKVRYVGCSNFSRDLVEGAQQHGRLESVQACHSLLDQEALGTLQQCCREHNTAFVAHSTLARGFLTGKYEVGHRFSGSDTRNACPHFSDEGVIRKHQLLHNLGKISEKYGKSHSQVAIRWVLDSPGVAAAAVGIKSISQLEDNLGSLHWKLSAEDFRMLSESLLPGASCSTRSQRIG